jgi:hypothetical protein
MMFMAVLFGGMMYFLRDLLKEKPPKKRPFRQTCIYTNQFGHLVRIDPDPDMMQEVEDYYHFNKGEARKALNSIKPGYRQPW